MPAVTGVTQFIIENSQAGKNVNDPVQLTPATRINDGRLNAQTISKILAEISKWLEKFQNTK